jgi:hypothetical protein
MECPVRDVDKACACKAGHELHAPIQKRTRIATKRCSPDILQLAGQTRQIPVAGSLDVNRTNTFINLKAKRRNIMPRGDRTGPNGLGSRTGRGAGYCSGNNEPGYTTAGGRGGAGGLGGRRGGGRGLGLGRGLNRGAGLGLRQRFGGAPEEIPPTQKEDLSRKAQELEAQIAEIKNQLNQQS